MNEMRISIEKLQKETSSGDVKYNSWNEKIH